MAKEDSQISRQARWQRKHRAMGLCVLCSLPSYKGWRCQKHYEQHKITMRLRYIPKVRGRYNVGGLTDPNPGPKPDGQAIARSPLPTGARAIEGGRTSRVDGVRRAKVVRTGARALVEVPRARGRITRGNGAAVASGAAPSSGAAKAAARRKAPRRLDSRTAKAVAASAARPRPGAKGSVGTGADRRSGR